MFNLTTERLREFVDENRGAIEQARVYYEISGGESVGEDGEPLLWITKKDERLRRYQQVANMLFIAALTTYDSTVLREFRSYLYMVAQELGQLQHRGAAGMSDGTTATYSIEGVDMDALR